MNRSVFAIGLNENTNHALQSSCAVLNLSLISCATISDALPILEKIPFCLVMLWAATWTSEDVQEAVRTLRELTFIPILVISTLDSIAPSLEIGADVCVLATIPFHILFSQMLALIRRNEMYNTKSQDGNNSTGVIFTHRDLKLDLRRHRVTLAGEEIRLQRREFRLLTLFIQNPGIVLTPDQISEAVWMSEDNYPHNVTVAIAGLRQKLKDNKSNPTYIETVHGIGYRFLADERSCRNASQIETN